MGRTVVVALGVLWAATMAIAATEQFPGESAKWRRYESPHFEMFSAAGDKDSRGLLHQLEMLRGLLQERLGLQERQPQAVTIYYFPNQRTFRPYCQPAQQQELAGYYLHRPDRAVIALSTAWGDKTARRVVFHEYVHHLNRALGVVPPLWYDEGVAELYSTVEFRKDGAWLGRPQNGYVEILRRRKMLPLSVLFAVDHQSPIYNTGRHSGLFYAQSWALLHYLHFGKTDLERERVREFLREALRGPHLTGVEAMLGCFESRLGIGAADIPEALDAYFATGKFFQHRTALPKVPGKDTYAVQDLASEEMRERLADLALRVNEQPQAKLVLLDAVQRTPGSARVWEALGADAWMQNDNDRAKECWEKALAAGSRNPAIYHELGQLEGQRWFAACNIELRLQPETAAPLRALYRRSIETTPGQFAAYEMLAWVEACVEQPDAANISLVESRLESLGNPARTLVALALIRHRRGDDEKAREFLRELEKFRPDHGCAVAAERILARLENRAVRPVAAPSAGPARTWIRSRGPELPVK